MIDTNFKIGDVVINKQFCEYEPFKLSNEHFKGTTARNQSWFDSLEYSKMKLTLKQLIEEIENRKDRNSAFGKYFRIILKKIWK